MPDKTSELTYTVIGDAIVNGKTKGEIVTLDDTVAIEPLIANGFIEPITQEV